MKACTVRPLAGDIVETRRGWLRTREAGTREEGGSAGWQPSRATTWTTPHVDASGWGLATKADGQGITLGGPRSCLILRATCW